MFQFNEISCSQCNECMLDFLYPEECIPDICNDECANFKSLYRDYELQNELEEPEDY